MASRSTRTISTSTASRTRDRDETRHRGRSASPWPDIGSRPFSKGLSPAFPLDRPIFSFSALALLVTALSIFLVLRVNEAYSRWWEARTLWGGIVNSSRNFGRQVTAFVGPLSEGSAERHEVAALHEELVYRQMAWLHALRLSLRREEDWDQLAPYLADEELDALRPVASKPTRILQTQTMRLAELSRTGRLSGLGQLLLDRALTALLDDQGGCGRIKNTPFRDRIAYFGEKVAWGIALLIPFCVIDPDNRFSAIELAVVPLMMLAFILTDRFGAELRNPFENLPNDTPMTAICRTIEIDLREQLGEDDVPEPIQAVDGVLM